MFMRKIGFDSQKYIRLQSERIRERMLATKHDYIAMQEEKKRQKKAKRERK